MSDDRQLRDELERVQSEVLRLKRALDEPEALHADLRARIDTLRRSRAQQQQKLAETHAQEGKLDEQLRAVMSANAKLQQELDDLLATERRLVNTTVHMLDPGRSRSGCMTVLALSLMLVVLGWLA